MTDEGLAEEITRVLDALDKCRAEMTTTQDALVDNLGAWSPSTIEVAHEHLGTLLGRLSDLHQELEPLEAEFRRRGLGEPVPSQIETSARRSAVLTAIEDAERAKQRADLFGLADPGWKETMNAFVETLRQKLRELDG